MTDLCHIKKTFFIVTVCVVLGYSSISASFIKKVTDHFAQKYGTEKVSTEHKLFIQSIMDEMGITKPIDIRYMNYTGLQIFGLYNAMAYLDSYLFISKYFFTKLTPEEQRFLIGHELGHIKQKYALKNMSLLYSLLFLSGLSSFGIYRMLKKKNIHKVIQITTAVCTFAICNRANLIAWTALRRSYEKDADRQSACRLNSSQAGVSFLNHLDELNTALSVKTKYDYSKWWNRITATHPSNEDRINLLNSYSGKI